MYDEAVTSFTIKLFCISTEPVNSCLSLTSSPNLFEPDEYIIDEEMYDTINCSANIDCETYKLP